MKLLEDTPSLRELLRMFPISIWTVGLVGLGFWAGITFGCGGVR